MGHVVVVKPPPETASPVACQQRLRPTPGAGQTERAGRRVSAKPRPPRHPRLPGRAPASSPGGCAEVAQGRLHQHRPPRLQPHHQPTTREEAHRRHALDARRRALAAARGRCR
ncbi:hypothetical protein QJS66_02545 [Kocuria rhizophila]|nr:hypothetical protein QJS66_02545 [Kocuria rhizophila]